MRAKSASRTFVVTASDHTPVEYVVRVSARRTVALYVFRDRRVEVRVPHGTSESSIRRFVIDRLPWIVRKRQELDPLPRPPAYRDGASHYLLGERHILRVFPGRPGTRQVEGELHVCVAQPEDESAVRAVLERWRREQAQALFETCLDTWYRKMSTLGIPYPHLTVRRMRTRWGSCSKRARISLSLALLKAPWACIEYVVVHEL